MPTYLACMKHHVEMRGCHAYTSRYVLDFLLLAREAWEGLLAQHATVHIAPPTGSPKPLLDSTPQPPTRLSLRVMLRREKKRWLSNAAVAMPHCGLQRARTRVNAAPHRITFEP